ncbi:hypothetical protein AFLA70_745g000271 [Aspergillus flavus AF70]|nr:hypothetical protein AFLA70_745g000271 [Aspergillus flavus AF70]
MLAKMSTPTCLTISLRDVHPDVLRSDGPVTLRKLDTLGSGGQGSVDKVELQPEGVICVRKQLNTKFGNRKVREELKREVGILKKFDDKLHFVKLVATYDDKDNGLGLLHLPVASCDLWSLLERPINERRQIMSDSNLERGCGCLVVALHFMHQQCIRHRDIKPQNILIHNDTLIFTDFGYSKDFSNFSSSVTMGHPTGTISWYAPEVNAHRPRGCGADVFSLGCVILEVMSVLSGHRLTDDTSFTRLQPYCENLEDAQGWIENQVPNSSPVTFFWLTICRFMLAKAPTRRPRMPNILARIAEEHQRNPALFDTICCRSCVRDVESPMVARAVDEVQSVEFSWGPDSAVLLQDRVPEDTQISGAAQRSSKSLMCYAYLLFVLSHQHSPPRWLIAALFHAIDISQILKWPLNVAGILSLVRWQLTLYFDNGRSLRCYGTLPIRHNPEFNFQDEYEDIGIHRAVFTPGLWANEVTLYGEVNCQKLRWRESGPKDKWFDPPIRMRSYEVYRT